MLKNKKLFYSILILAIALILIAIILFFMKNMMIFEETREKIREEERGYYGFSTFGQCQNDNDCLISGCNREICQSRFEEEMASICILPNRPTPSQLGYGCRCHLNQCQWRR